jgi:predicted transposase YbfD/YdcC
MARVEMWRGSLVVRPVGDDELGRFAAELRAHHWLGARLSGQVVRYVATVDGVWVVLAGFGSAVLRCPVREGLLGWDEATRSRRLGLVVASQRLCVLPAGRWPNLASAVLGACLRRVSSDYQERFGHPVLAVETFTDPARHTGACYAAVGFTPVGATAGFGRTRGGRHFHGRPKTYWLRPLHRRGLAALAGCFDSPLTLAPSGRPALDMNTVDIDSGHGLLDALAQLADHRMARGKRHDLAALLAVAVAAVLCGADGYKAITQWAAKQSQQALARLGVRFNKRLGRHVPPSYHTLRGAIRCVDTDALDRAVSGWAWDQVRAGNIDGARLRRLALALDGKTVRGAVDADGRQLHLFSAIVHGHRTVVAQTAVDKKSNEITAFAPLLDMLATTHHDDNPDHDNNSDDNNPDHDNPQDGGAEPARADTDGEPGQRQPPPLDVIVTGDAMHTQRKHAIYIRRRGGDYVLMAKDNQPTLLDRLKTLPWHDMPAAHQQDDDGHGRYERRTIKVLSAPSDLDFPDARQVFLIERTVVDTVKRRKKNGKTKTKKRTSYVRAYGVTSLTAKQAGPADLARLVRDHWQIEAHHNIRDTTFHEDASQIRTGNGPRAMAILRNIAVNLFRRFRFDNIAAARRDMAWDQTGLVLNLLGV